MEGFQAPDNNVEQGSDVIRRNEKLRSAGEVIKNLFESVGDNAIKRIMENPTYEGFSERR